MKTKLDLDKWNRKEHFNFFKKFDEPFYHINVNIDCTLGLESVKTARHSIFAWYFHNAMKASNAIEEFRCRIEGDEVFVYDSIHASPTIRREDGTFGFGHILFQDDFELFQKSLKDEIDRVRRLDGLFTASERPDVIHYSALPWFSFNGLSHPRNYGDGDSIPKVTFGKIFERDGKSWLPLSVQVHHGLIDGYHVSRFVDEFQRLLND
jgi:chloramphenicol O-acetyltransferase type A